LLKLGLGIEGLQVGESRYGNVGVKFLKSGGFCFLNPGVVQGLRSIGSLVRIFG